MLRFSLRVFTANNQGFKNSNLDIIRASNQCRHYKVNKKIIDPARVRFLINLLGISEPEAIKLIKDHKSLNQPTQEDIAKSFAICVEYGIEDSIKSTRPLALFLKPHILEQRINFYRDMGCTQVPPAMILPFYLNLHLSVSDLKERQVLPADTDVTKNLLNCLHKPPPDVPPFESIPEDCAIGEIHRNVLVHYLRWKFELTQEQLDRIMRFQTTRKYASFSMIKKMVDILENEFGFTKDKIRRNSFLIFRSPFNAEQILREIDYIGIMDTKSMIIRYPRLLKVPVEKLREKIRILKEFKVSDIAISKCPDILTLTSKTIYNRLVEFQSMEELHGYCAHPRFLMLIFAFKSVLRRLQILKELKVRCVSFHLICTGNMAFQRYISCGSDRTKGKDLLRFLSFELGLDYGNPRVEMIKRHSMWCQIAFIHMQKTFFFLKAQKFSDEDILDNIQIVLYQCSQIEAELRNIDSLTLDDSRELTPSRKLALCLYNIEKAYHFDGNGVWNYQSEDSSSPAKVEEKENPRSLSHTN